MAAIRRGDSSPKREDSSRVTSVYGALTLAFHFRKDTARLEVFEWKIAQTGCEHYAIYTARRKSRSDLFLIQIQTYSHVRLCIAVCIRPSDRIANSSSSGLPLKFPLREYVFIICTFDSKTLFCFLHSIFVTFEREIISYFVIFLFSYFSTPPVFSNSIYTVWRFGADNGLNLVVSRGWF